MPTYDYRCRACGHEFEHFQQITAPVMRKCPACAKLKLERLIGTGAGIIFKGGGFYETDYRSEGYRKAAEQEKSSSQATSKTESGGAVDTAKPADTGPAKAGDKPGDAAKGPTAKEGAPKGSAGSSGSGRSSDGASTPKSASRSSSKRTTAPKRSSDGSKRSPKR